MDGHIFAKKCKLKFRSLRYLTEERGKVYIFIFLVDFSLIFDLFIVLKMYVLNICLCSVESHNSGFEQPYLTILTVNRSFKFF